MSSMRQPVRRLPGGLITAYQSNAVMDNMDAQRPMSQNGVNHTTRGISIRKRRKVFPSSSDVSNWTFSCTGSATIAISAGVWQVGDVSYEVPSGTVTLTGAVEYVYAYHMKDHSSSGFGHSSTLPNSAGNQWKIILAKYAGSGGAWSQAWLGHKGNIILTTPTA